MKLYYIAVGSNGKRVKGLIEAADASRAAAYLREHSLFPIRIEERNPQIVALTKAFSLKMSNKDLVFFTRQISSMLSSGLTLTQSLSILKNQTHKAAVINVVDGIISAIEEGKNFSAALAQFSIVFSPVYIALVRAGESSGVLDKVMNRLADNLEKQYNLKAKIRGALIYPAILFVLMIVVVIVMVTFVIPQLNNLYQSLNIPLPFITQFMVSVSNLIINYFLFFISVFIIGFFYFNKWRKTGKGKYYFDSFLLRIPVFGKLIYESTMSEFARTFGMLAGTGALIIDSLKKSADAVNNKVYQNAIIEVADSVEQGVSIGDAMAAHIIFPSILIEMVKVGEQTGKLDDSLTRVADYYEREVEQSVKTLTTAMEPIILIALAIGVVFIVLSVIVPIYRLITSIS